MILVFLIYALMALTFLVGQQALKLVAPIWFIGFRMTIAGILLLAFLYFFRTKLLKIRRADWGKFLKVALFHAYIPFVTEFWGLQYLSAPKTALLFNFTPVVTALCSYFMLKEKLVWQQILGLIIGILGFIPILFDLAPKELMAGELFKISLPELAIIISVITSVYAWLTVQDLVKQHYDPILVNGLGMLLGGLLAFITSLCFETWPSLNLADFKLLLLWSGILILISNILFYNLYAKLLKQYSATLLAFAGLFTPLFTAIWELIFRSHLMPRNFFFSLLIVSVGLSIYLFATPSKSKILSDEHIL